MTPIVQVRDGRRSRLVAAAVAGAFALLFLLVLPRSANAANATWPQNTALVLSGPSITLRIDAGSTASSLAVTSTTFTVVTSPTDSFVVRYANPAGKLTNDGNISECNTQAGGDNVVTVGPSKTVLFTPSTVSCGSGGSGGGSTTATAEVVMPNGGESFAAGGSTTVQWQTNGGSISSINIKLSTDGGTTFGTSVATGESNDGVYTWTIPTLSNSTTQARIKIEALDGSGSVVASDTSNANFSITVPQASGGGGGGTAAPPPSAPPPTTPPSSTPPPAKDSTATGVFRATEAISNNPTINDDKGLAAVTAVIEKKCDSGDLIKGSQPSVYYCGADGRRYVFVNEKAFKTWFAGFSGVKTISDATLGEIPIGGNITYKPGVRMIKITSDPKVYAVSRGGLLRWVKTEHAASVLYGPNWNKKIDDVPDSFFVNYKPGADISDTDVDPATVPPADTMTTSASSESSSGSVALSCSTVTTFTSLLSVGSDDAQVLPLQQVLKCLGHISASTALTGHFGSATETAVKAFQASKGLSQSGSTDAATRASLNTYKK